VPGVVHEAALASGQLTRDGTGGQLTFPEVIMSRLIETGIPNQQPEAEAVCMVLASIVWATRAQESSDVICSPMRSGSKACRVPT